MTISNEKETEGGVEEGSATGDRPDNLLLEAHSLNTGSITVEDPAKLSLNIIFTEKSKS